MAKSFKTTKGTELPILNLRGKDYLEVKYRLVWFREDHPDWGIETSFINVGPDFALAKAIIKDEKERIISTSHKYEDIKGFPDFNEKAESGAIGRALALIGYGTQFCADDLDEGQRLADSPAQTKRTAKAPISLGGYVIPVGQNYQGKMLKDVPTEELKKFMAWIMDKSMNDPKGQAKKFMEAATAYVKEQEDAQLAKV